MIIGYKQLKAELDTISASDKETPMQWVIDPKKEESIFQIIEVRIMLALYIALPLIFFTVTRH